jgi:hypothetical protein
MLAAQVFAPALLDQFVDSAAKQDLQARSWREAGYLEPPEVADRPVHRANRVKRLPQRHGIFPHVASRPDQRGEGGIRG